MKPAGYQLWVKPDEVEEMSKGGIYLGTDEREAAATVTGELLAIGPSAWKAFDDGTHWAKVGDKILYKKYAGVRYKDENTGETSLFINDADVVAVLEEKDKWVSKKNR